MTGYTKMTLENSCTCTDEREQPLDCGGDCFRDDASMIADEVALWVARNPSEHGYLIKGAGMGWSKASGSRDWDGREPLHEAIGVNSTWTQRYEFNTTEIWVVQSHHDTLGEHYTVRAKTSDEE